jgi:LacI family transcriptional regulator
VESGYTAMQRVLARGEPCSAIFCAGDLLAIGAMRALADAGLRVPEALSVVGLDDIDVAAYLTPALTTISQSSAEMARQGVKLLMRLLTGGGPAQPELEPELEPESERIVVRPELIVRGSTAPAPSTR